MTVSPPERLRREAKFKELTLVLERTRIPERMHDGLLRYVLHHIKPGDFLTAVLRNDLRAAISKADDENKHLLFDYVAFIHNRAPGSCWGSYDAVEVWLKEE